MAFCKILPWRMPSFLSKRGSRRRCKQRNWRCNRVEGTSHEAKEVAQSYPSLQQMREELNVSEEFLARYNRPGPRYTSYPTAPVWNDSFGPDALERVLEEAEQARSPVSRYMHIPFCESLCLFCACNVIIQKDKRVAPPYLSVLKQEMERVSQSVSKNREVVQFHWGGGTPTYLTPEQIEDLFGAVRARFTFAAGAEFGIEVDPRVTSREHIE